MPQYLKSKVSKLITNNPLEYLEELALLLFEPLGNALAARLSYVV